MLARVQGVEIRYAIDAEHNGLAVDDELLLAVLQRCLDDPGKAAGPVVTAARDQPYVAAVALDPQAIAVIFYFVDPVGAVGYDVGGGGKAKFERAGHALR